MGSLLPSFSHTTLAKSEKFSLVLPLTGERKVGAGDGWGKGCGRAKGLNEEENCSTLSRNGSTVNSRQGTFSRWAYLDRKKGFTVYVHCTKRQNPDV